MEAKHLLSISLSVLENRKSSDDAIRWKRGKRAKRNVCKMRYRNHRMIVIVMQWREKNRNERWVLWKWKWSSSQKGSMNSMSCCYLFPFHEGKGVHRRKEREDRFSSTKNEGKGCKGSTLWFPPSIFFPLLRVCLLTSRERHDRQRSCLFKTRHTPHYNVVSTTVLLRVSVWTSTDQFTVRVILFTFHSLPSKLSPPLLS